jgi:muramoyltetrapeptide carboxypeptidase
MNERMRPRALRRGDAVRIVAPSSPAPEDRKAFLRGIGVLEEMGLRPVWSERIFDRRGYLAGPDEDRAAELAAAFTDPETAGVICVRGGDGAPRLLDRLDYEVVRANPKPFVGYSDVTALHGAFAARCGLVTLHGPMPASDLQRRNLPPLTRSEFERALFSVEPLGRLPVPEDRPLRVLSPGVAEGPLVGGNLSLVTALIGTPFAFDLRGAILFLEDIMEAPHRIDRMLAMLRLSGGLSACAGILLGDFLKAEPADGHPERNLTVEQVLEDYLAGRDIPVLSGFPAGHGELTLSLPLGVRARLVADPDGASGLELLEPAWSR